ncbi:alpha/beta hydrolase [Sorangium sp. So ce1000]|uniref:alpha/beta hydrolase n=1 Tax=Sorangium sp. So ce1000 TaxID=3133325 RepID=UPI003F5ED32F
MNISVAALAGLGLAALTIGCGKEDRALAEERPVAPAMAERRAVEPPLVATEVPVPGDRPVFIVTGPRGACPRMVFLHGMCGHGLGYVQAFQRAAREHGGVLGLQGDVPCGADGVFTKYAPDVEEQDGRIRSALSACGGEAEDLVVIGYSQGAYIAERLAERWPARYSRLVLLGAPTTPSAARLRHIRGAVMISGELDAKHRMKAGASGLIAAKIPAVYREMPGARHGELLDAERVMDEALDWLDANARPRPESR